MTPKTLPSHEQPFVRWKEQCWYNAEGEAKRREEKEDNVSPTGLSLMSDKEIRLEQD